MRQDNCNDVKKIFTDLDEVFNAEKIKNEKNQKLKKYVKKDSAESPTRKLQPKNESINVEKNDSQLSSSSNSSNEKSEPEKTTPPQVIQLEKVEEPKQEE